MGSSLYEPINVYKPFAPDIGVVDGPFEYLTVAGLRLPLPFTTRMTVVRLSNSDLVLHSPIKFDERLAKELRQLGKVRHLVSPNQFHYAHIGEWARAFPNPDFTNCGLVALAGAGHNPKHLSLSEVIASQASSFMTERPKINATTCSESS